MLLRRRLRGFTLIEVMVVVAIVGILALLAVVAYKRWVRMAYMAEAQDMVQDIRAAEESFRTEAGGYLNVSNTLDLGYLYPAPTPGAFKSNWGGACSSCTPMTGWLSLAVEPKGPVAFGYAVVADNTNAPGTNVSHATSSMSLAVDVSGLTAPWYVVEAVGDINGDGVFTRILGLSASNQLIIDREGE